MANYALFSFILAIPLFVIAKGPEFVPPPGSKEPEEVDGRVLFESLPPGEPYLTGPLLCPAARTMPYGHINLEPYVFVNNNVGHYNNHWHIHRFSKAEDSVNMQYYMQCGISDFMDITMVPQVFYNHTGSRNNWEYGDLYMGTGFQLYRSRFDSWLPSIKLGIGEIFPTGKYDNLDFSQLGTDVGGGGSFGTIARIVIGDLWYFGGHHFLALRWNNSVAYFTKVQVKGSNAYGGDNTTNGTVEPGVAFNSILSGEFTLAKHWALALDIDFVYTAPTKFTGTTLAFVGRNHSSFLLSFAPALEYNLNQNMGIIGGLWITAFGENASDFYNGVIAFSWVFP